MKLAAALHEFHWEKPVILIDERRYAEEMERELAERDPQPFNLSTTIP